MDPLVALPAEIVLRILDFAPASSIAGITRANKAWHSFIDDLHQDAIYSSHSKTDHPLGTKDFAFLNDRETFDRYFESVSSWKELCRRQALLERNYDSPHPKVKDNFMVPLFDANRTWRFRADLKRRIFICTSQDGGLTVTDMDGKGRLWYLGHDQVPPFAHLEYHDGLAVWSLLGDTLEVWETSVAGLRRGVFRQVATIDCPLHHLRGFHLVDRTLCVVGDDGHALVYDLSSESYQLRTRLDIAENAVGHLCQAGDAVMYSMGQRGYDVHDKTAGTLLSELRPDRVKKIYHVNHPERPALGEVGSHTRSVPPLSSFALHSEDPDDIFQPIEVQDGALPFAATDTELRIPIEEDEWGAGLFSGDLMVGISKAGRVLVCSDWREALKSEEGFVRHTSIIECEDNEENFQLGGWLSIRDNRILFEILDKVYLVSLNADGTVATASQKEKRPSWCFHSALNPLMQRRLQSGISMMQLFDDCVMTTCWLPGRTEGRLLIGLNNLTERLPTKGIRILSLAPRLD